MFSWVPPLVKCSRSTERQSDPLGGITNGFWLALVLTVNGLEVMIAGPVLPPNVVVHVVPPFGIVAVKPIQLGPATAPTRTVTVLTEFVDPPFQYISNIQMPALMVWDGKPVNDQMVVVPGLLDAWIVHSVPAPLTPAAMLIEKGVAHGAAPLPCR
jgi:hypothetical protein